MNELISFLENQDVEYQKGKLLSSCTSVGIGGAAKLFLAPNSKEKFTKVLGYLYKQAIPYRIVGNMTNILPADRGVETVLVSTLKINTIAISEKAVYADCGTLFSKLILSASKNSLGGYESLFGIPGTVGAMLSINAGAYGASVSDNLRTVDVYIPEDNSVVTLKKEDIAFFYRDSELKRQGLAVLGASFDFSFKPKRDIDLCLKEIRRRRAQTQPISEKTLGSVFKRTDKFPASYMIDRCGLKGRAVGNILVSQKHAGFFVNAGGGTADDFLRLVRIVKNIVKEKYDVILEEEFEYLM